MTRTRSHPFDRHLHSSSNHAFLCYSIYLTTVSGEHGVEADGAIKGTGNEALRATGQASDHWSHALAAALQHVAEETVPCAHRHNIPPAPAVSEMDIRHSFSGGKQPSRQTWGNKKD